MKNAFLCAVLVLALSACSTLADRCADKAKGVDPLIRESYFNECVGANQRPIPVKVH